ncbi:GNAT family N-acetyltransferase [Flavobacterium faecale]|uniref:GNAT family N-acetyltransferase n=1 Tax=Flavobacterium faecale TaxID=1355330 RepID=A0A2S1LI29_9FLAO|nr:GNAT family N-acetyltransferase [Flavobacterium faecale]AWG23377.1 GNAT family N-acetyltransferase [Flavobacterium faecale]
MSQHFQKANVTQSSEIWTILQQAIARRKADGSDQWQDGYPNPEVIQSDINKNAAYVLIEGQTIIGYCALLINDEPEYQNIEGQWITNDDFVVFHRVAISESQLGKGLAKKLMQFIEAFAINNNIYSIKADTNFDNHAMMAIFDSLGYVYCGEVYFRGTPRRAYEKVLEQKR